MPQWHILPSSSLLLLPLRHSLAMPTILQMDLEIFDHATRLCRVKLFGAVVASDPWMELEGHASGRGCTRFDAHSNSIACCSVDGVWFHEGHKVGLGVSFTERLDALGEPWWWLRL